MKHKLSKEDMDLAYETAYRRYLASSGSTHERRSIEGSFIIKLRGFGAEIAVARMFHIEPKMNDGILAKYDLVINEKKVDVKHNYHPKGDLLVPSKKKDDGCNVYILVGGDFPEYELVGWVYAEELFKPENIKTYNGYESYKVYFKDLKIFK